MALCASLLSERLQACRPSQSRSCGNVARIAKRRQGCPVRASGGGNYSSDGNKDSDLAFQNAALREAVLIFAEAQQLSQQQLKQELQESLLSSTSWSDNPATESSQQSFWVEQGLTSKQAEKLTSEVARKFPNLSLDQLALRLKRLIRILPDVSSADLVYKDCTLLDLDVNLAVRNLVSLVDSLPKRNVSEVVLKEPRLMYCEDLELRLEKVISKLMDLHPSKDERVVVDLIVENPQLLYRMPYHMHATMLDDLPIEIQNMMLVVDDKGIGFLYKYYKERGQFIT